MLNGPLDLAVDSSIPPPPSFQQHKLRPWYLVATMGLAWVIGLYGLMSACSMVAYLREGVMSDVDAVRRAAEEALDPIQVIVVVQQAAHLRAISEHQDVTFPLHVARLILSALLVITSGLAMRGRRGTRTLALQALAANVVLAVVDYVLTRGVRTAWIDAVVQTRDILPKIAARAGVDVDVPLWDYLSRRAVLWWLERIKFAVFDLSVFVLAALALTRVKTKLFFDAVARATEQAEEP